MTIKHEGMRLCRATHRYYPIEKMMKIDGFWYSENSWQYKENISQEEKLNDAIDNTSSNKVEEYINTVDIESLIEENNFLNSLLLLKQATQEEVEEFTCYKSSYQGDASNNVATPYAMLSDIHLGKKTLRAETYNLNNYNIAAATKRIDRFFSKLESTVEKLSYSYEYDRVVLNINGGLFEEVYDHHRTSKQVALLNGLIYSGITQIATKYPIEVVCITQGDNTLELLLYSHLAESLKNNPNVLVNIARGEHIITEAGKYRVLHHHGDSIKYANGLGGLTIPVNKAIIRLKEAFDFDYMVVSHHQRYTPGPNFVINGSVCGVDRETIKQGFETPRQAFFLVDHKYGKMFDSPIILGDV
jgi:hypothetical protein